MGDQDDESRTGPVHGSRGVDAGERDRLAALAGRGPGGDAVPAATVIPVRDTAAGPELLMLRRDSRLAFAGGLWVFPGGRVDPEDFPADAPDDLEAAELAAAVREAREEAGLALDPTTFERLSHWTPPPQTNKRYSTAFFVAPVLGDVAIVIDDSEIRAHRWVTPEGALALHASGEIELAPPTYITLRQLSGASSAAELMEQVAALPYERFSTRIGTAGEFVAALFHGDVAYEDESHDETTLNRDGARHRLWLHSSGWIYERRDG